MKASTEHAWVLDVLRDLSDYANNHGLAELSDSLVALRQQYEAPLKGHAPHPNRHQSLYRRDYSV